MKQKMAGIVAVLVLTGSLLGCMAVQIPQVYQSFEPERIASGRYQPKADHFLIIMDASSSMAEYHNGWPKFEQARELVSRLNQTLPEIPVQGGLRSFGHGQCVGTAKTMLHFGMAPYATDALQAGLDKVKCAGGTSPLALALEGAATDLRQRDGKLAVIIFSDGKEMRTGAIEAANQIKQQHGANLCLYTVLMGDDPDGRKLLKEIATLGGCGFAVNGDDIASPAQMADYVKKVFLRAGQPALDSDGDGVTDRLDRCPQTPRGVQVDARGCPPDTDGDGVFDYLDKCPGTPQGVRVNAQGCPLDSDGDGVYDYQDKCPRTPRGAPVDRQGCPLDTDGDGVYDYQDKCPGTPKGAQVDARGCWVLTGVRFDSGQWELKPASRSSLDALVRILTQNPALRLEIQGHTDNVGAAAFNQQLSEKRARAVMTYLTENGIDAKRLSAKGYGLSRPAATNTTARGRAINRRVELQPLR